MTEKLYFFTFCSIALFLCLLQPTVFSVASELHFSIEPSDVVVVEDQIFVWDCAAEGETSINITWRKDGRVTEDDDRRLVLANGSLYFATIEHKKRKVSDEGMYQCVASSDVGTIVSKVVRLQIATIPSFTITPETKTVRAGESARFRCKADAIPEPAYTWEIDREALSRNDRYIVLPSGVLQIHNTRSSDDGKAIRCIAQNIAGHRHSVDANLHVSPIDSPTDEGTRRMVILPLGLPHVVKRTGDTVVLECLISGAHETDTKITWTRQDGKKLNLQRTSYFGKTNLKIEELKATDSGMYLCTAINTNTHEWVYASRRLEIHDPRPPIITVAPVSVSLAVGRTARFSCLADGDPQPSIQWLKNGEPVNFSGRINLAGYTDDMVISGVHTGGPDQDDAMYQCVAENIHGQVQASARLKVLKSLNGPGPPQRFRGYSLTATSILVSWEAAESPRGIVGYTVHYARESGGREVQIPVSPDTRSYLVEDLEQETMYVFYAVAYSMAASSDRSEIIHVATRTYYEESPTFSLSNTPAGIVVRWDEVVEERYRIYYREHGEDVHFGHVDVNGAQRVFMIKGLKSDTVYDIAMSAFSSSGEGKLSDVATIRTTNQQGFLSGDATKMPPPTNVWVEATPRGFIKVKWDYSVAYDIVTVHYSPPFGDQELEVTVDGSYNEVVLTGLQRDSEYKVYIVAYTSNNITDPSPEMIVRTRFYVNPWQPTDVRAIPLSSTAVGLMWSPPLNESVSFYSIHCKPTSGGQEIKVLTNGDLNKYLLTSLDPDTEYRINIAAYYDPQFSEDVTVSTSEED
ncbi:protogenin A-like [Ptychodera flava]|uniref:protogenin A-like n=1 Tax=Ptychodera flava TaxID=63121 RepID=UPI00396A7E5B